MADDSTFQKTLARISAMPSYDQNMAAQQAAARSAPGYRPQDHIAPVSTPRLDAGPSVTNMGAPSSMTQNDHAAGAEYARASRLLNRLSRHGSLAQRANAAQAAIGARENANAHGFNPGGIASFEGEQQATQGRLQDKAQASQDMSLLQRRDRALINYQTVNPGTIGVGGHPIPMPIFNPNATDNMPSVGYNTDKQEDDGSTEPTGIGDSKLGKNLLGSRGPYGAMSSLSRYLLGSKGSYDDLTQFANKPKVLVE